MRQLDLEDRIAMFVTRPESFPSKIQYNPQKRNEKDEKENDEEKDRIKKRYKIGGVEVEMEELNDNQMKNKKDGLEDKIKSTNVNYNNKPLISFRHPILINNNFNNPQALLQNRNEMLSRTSPFTEFTSSDSSEMFHKNQNDNGDQCTSNDNSNYLMSTFGNRRNTIFHLDVNPNNNKNPDPEEIHSRLLKLENIHHNDAFYNSFDKVNSFIFGLKSDFDTISVYNKRCKRLLGDKINKLSQLHVSKDELDVPLWNSRCKEVLNGNLSYFRMLRLIKDIKHESKHILSEQCVQLFNGNSHNDNQFLIVEVKIRAINSKGTSHFERYEIEHGWFKALLQNSPIPQCLLATDGTVCNSNETMNKLFLSEVTNTIFTSLILRKDCKLFKDSIIILNTYVDSYSSNFADVKNIQREISYKSPTAVFKRLTVFSPVSLQTDSPTPIHYILVQLLNPINSI